MINTHETNDLKCEVEGACYLTVVVADERWCLPMNRLLTVVRRPRIFHFPEILNSVTGGMYHEGKLIPVIDLIDFAKACPVRASCGCVVVAKVKDRSGEVNQVGLSADSVEDAFVLPQSDIMPSGKIKSRLGASFTAGLINVVGGYRFVVNIDKVVEKVRDGIPISLSDLVTLLIPGDSEPRGLD